MKYQNGLLGKRKSIIPKQDQFLVECFPEKGKYYLVLYPFEGRLAHQTLGILLTKRLERLSLKPLGFVCNDYGLAIWAVDDIGKVIEARPELLSELLAEDMLGDDLEAWLEESSVMRRLFVIALSSQVLLKSNCLAKDEKHGALQYRVT